MPSTFLHAQVLVSSRTDSEDRAAVIERGGALVVVVADGAGQMRGGALASDSVIEAVTRTLDHNSVDLESAEAWKYILHKTDAELAEMMIGETTAVVIVLAADQLIGVSVGDSDAGVVRSSDIDDLTAGQKEPRLGSGHAAPVTFFRGALDGTLIVCIYYLFKYARRDKIAAIARGRRPVHDVAADLENLVRLPSGRFQDDVVIVIGTRSAGAGTSMRASPTLLQPERHR